MTDSPCLSEALASFDSVTKRAKLTDAADIRAKIPGITQDIIREARESSSCGLMDVQVQCRAVEPNEITCQITTRRKMFAGVPSNDSARGR